MKVLLKDPLFEYDEDTEDYYISNYEVIELPLEEYLEDLFATTGGDCPPMYSDAELYLVITQPECEEICNV